MFADVYKIQTVYSPCLIFSRNDGRAYTSLHLAGIRSVLSWLYAISFRLHISICLH